MSDPVVTVNNQSTHDIYVDGDPNWDDQVLKIDGKRSRGVYTLAPGATITVSVEWSGPGDDMMMGVIFSDAANYDTGGVGFYQLSFGQDPESGDLGVTDCNVNATPQVAYTLQDPTPWTLTMIFVDSTA